MPPWRIWKTCFGGGTILSGPSESLIVTFRLYIGRRKNSPRDCQGDRLDFRLEVAELQQSPTASLEYGEF
ncbi:MAG: hypothetical protein DMG57_24225 [Acidobacteria bacterium]|nr:MAG: hypothetical protein DMG57_24225 [Acidobacteriota bacterium]